MILYILTCDRYFISLLLLQDVHLSTAKSAALLECNPEALDSSIQDLICINDLSEMAILHNLRIRYKEDKICL